MQDLLFYLQLGWSHIISWDALDHQLFVLALAAVYTLKDWTKKLVLITAFTIGHSITLVLSTLDLFRLPSKLMEILIPVTILITALDNIVMKENSSKLMKINYTLALVFGLVHGMGFANTARVVLLDNQSVFFPLLGFNIGLEIGQIVVLGIIILFQILFIKLLKLANSYWIFGTSTIALICSVYLILERL